MLKNWQKLNKNKNRNTEMQKKHEAEFISELDHVFDISGNERRIETGNTTCEHIETNSLISGRKNVPESANDITNYDDDEDNDSDSIFIFKEKKASTSKKIVSSVISSALDRTNVYDRRATLILGSILSEMGYKEQDVILSRSTLRRTRMQQRKEIAQEIKTAFTTQSQLTIHLDGKLLPDLTGRETIDRLAILVSGGGKYQLLGEPLLTSGTGENQTEAICKLVRACQLEDKISGLCFDTTSTNSGKIKGTCVLVEKELGKNLLYFPCRHHILEIVLSAVMRSCEGPTTSPEINLFKRFKKEWKHIDQNVFKIGADDASIVEQIGNTMGECLDFAKSQLLLTHPRHDSAELLELIVIFLGGDTDMIFKKCFESQTE